jgi:hypothetical protein
VTFLEPSQIAELVASARWADIEARSDLAAGGIRDEDDYTSNFTGALRRIINSHSKTGLRAKSFMLPTSAERASGTDAAIVLQRDGRMKVALFEAKWPRFSDPGYVWDYKQSASGLSHFSDQLDRQARLADVFAIFEMFYCEYAFTAQPAFMNDRTSSCVWHSQAATHRAARSSPDAVWTQSDLRGLLAGNRQDIGEILQAVGECRVGQPLFFPGIDSLAREFQMTGPILAIEAPPGDPDSALPELI